MLKLVPICLTGRIASGAFTDDSACGSGRKRRSQFHMGGLGGGVIHQPGRKGHHRLRLVEHCPVSGVTVVDTLRSVGECRIIIGAVGGCRLVGECGGRFDIRYLLPIKFILWVVGGFAANHSARYRTKSLTVDDGVIREGSGNVRF